MEQNPTVHELISGWFKDTQAEWSDKWRYEVTRVTKRLGRASPKSGERRSLRKIAAELAKIGEALAATGLPSAKEAARAYFARSGQPYSAKSVRAMLAQRLPGEPRSVSE